MGKYNNEDPNKGFLDLKPHIPLESDSKNTNVNINLEEIKERTGFQNPYDVNEKIDAIFNPQKTKESRPDESRNSKFSKSNYILTHKPNGSVKSKKQGLLILAADTNMAFYDWDMIYREYRSNAQNEQEQKRLARRTISDIKEDCINEVLEKEQRKFDIDKMEPVDRMKIKLHEKLLYKISKKKKLLDWLYEESHIGITEENKERYINIVGFEPADGGIYTDIDKKWKENKDENTILQEAYKEAKRFIKYKKKIGGTVDWVFDYEKCKKSFIKEFGQDLTEDEKAIITPEFCERLIHIYIIPYWGKMENAKKLSKNSRINTDTIIKNIKENEENVVRRLKEGVRNATENLQHDIMQESREINWDVENAAGNFKEEVNSAIESMKSDMEEIYKVLESGDKKNDENFKNAIEIMKINHGENIKRANENLKMNIKKSIKDTIEETKTIENLNKHVKWTVDRLNRNVETFSMNVENEIKKLTHDQKENRNRKMNYFPEFLERYNKLNLLCQLFEESQKNDNRLKNSYKEFVNHLKIISKKKNKELHWGVEEYMLDDEADEENVKKIKNQLENFLVILL